MVSCFYFFVTLFLCTFAKCDKVLDVETIHDLSYLLKASGNIFLNVSDAR